jgi:type IV pilus assembly protein PilC
MASFAYRATNEKGETVEGTVEGLDRTAVVKSLAEQKLKPLSIKEAKAKRTLTIPFLGEGKVKTDQIVIFTRELSAMVGAGVPLLRALTSLNDHSESPALKKVLADVIKDVEAGQTLGDALGKHPTTFNDVYVNMVRAGEAAGILDDILKRLALQLEKSTAIRKRVRSAMTYPMVLVGITVLAFFGLMLFVIPQIGKILTDLGGPDAELPLLTQIMLGISHVLISFWYIIFPLLIGGVFLGIRYLRSTQGKAIFHRLVLRAPGIKTIIMKVAVARFSRTFSALIGAGVPVLEALEVTAHAVGNIVYQEALMAAGKEVKNGASLSSIIEKNSLFPAIVPQMLAVGEETGQTDTVLVKVADFFEDEVDVAIEGVSSIIEPVMIVFMGSMVGLIAASVMLPIASLSQNIK